MDTIPPLWLGIILAVVASASCAEQYEEMPADRVCLDTAYAISNRVYTCTNDGDLATAAFDTFQAETTCLVKDVSTEPIAAYYDCPTKVLRADCAQIAAINSPAGYLALSPKCPIILEVRGGQP